MAEKIVSPGVFTRERDLSFLPAGIAQIGAAIIGPTVKGPAFEPVIIESFKEFEATFGPKTLDSYVPYTVEGYLKSAGRVTVIRTLGLSGYTPEMIGITLAGGNSVKATAEITFSDKPNETTVLTLTDQDGVAKTFEIDNENDGAAGSNIALNGIAAAGGGAVGTAADLIAKVNAQSNFDITATADGTTKVILTMDVGGASGNIAITSTLTGSTVSGDLTIFTGGVDASDLDSESNEVVAVLHPTQVDPDATFTPTLITATSQVDLKLTADVYSNVTTFTTGQTLPYVYSCSIDTKAENWIGKVFGNTPKGRIQPVYNYMLFKNYASRSFSEDSSLTTAVTNNASVDLAVSYAQKDAYEARTPWIVSQNQNTYKSPVTTRLFKLHTRSHGASTNYQYKVAILNIKPAGAVIGSDYGSFSIQLRRVDLDGSIHAGNSPYPKSGDRDLSPHIVEQFNGLTLDPNSPNFIARVIGDRYQKIDANGKLTVFGDYPNLSRHVWVEVPEEVKDQGISPNLVPFGFEALIQPVPVGVGTLPTASFVGHTNAAIERASGGTATSHKIKKTQIADNVYNKKIFYGFDYTDTDNYNYLLPLPASETTAGNNKHFNLSHCSCLLYTSPSPRDGLLSRMPSSA